MTMYHMGMPAAFAKWTVTQGEVLTDRLDWRPEGAGRLVRTRPPVVLRRGVTLTRPLAALVLGAALLAIGCAHPHANGIDGPVVETIHHSQTYEVNPLNPNDLRRSISDQWRCGAAECAIGKTHSRTSYTYTTAMTPAGVCAVISVHVKVETTITIPHWEPPGLTSQARRTWWSQIQTKVTRHENHHVFISEDGGKAIAAALASLTTPNCQALAQTAAVTANQELLRIEELQMQFDRAEGPLLITAPPP
jgi:predicted secreted Zn-dependent protease